MRRDRPLEPDAAARAEGSLTRHYGQYGRRSSRPPTWRQHGVAEDARAADPDGGTTNLHTISNADLDKIAVAIDARQSAAPHLISRCAADIEPKPIDFIWLGRIARGKHTAVAGEPGDGKSQLSVYAAAMISTGGPWPCGEGHAPVGNVIILNAEDGADDTIVPRLIAAGADLRRIHIVSAVLQEGGKGRRTFNLQADLRLLEQKIAEIGNVVLVIIDPISSYMGKIDSHNNAEVRGALEPASEMAERLRVAILSITHFSKTGSGGNTKALHRFIGSIAFVGAPRAAFAVIEDADNSGRMLFLHAKNNMAQKPQGLAYRLEQTIVGELGIVASRVTWESGPVTVTANQALAAAAGGTARQTAKADAEGFLREALARGPVTVPDLESEARAAGLLGEGQRLSYSKPLRAAANALGVVNRREGFGPGATYWWSLPCVPSDTMLAHACPLSKEGTHGEKGTHEGTHGGGESPPSGARQPCAQCGEDDGQQELRDMCGHPVWLHQQCVRFWRQGPARA